MDILESVTVIPNTPMYADRRGDTSVDCMQNKSIKDMKIRTPAHDRGNSRQYEVKNVVTHVTESNQVSKWSPPANRETLSRISDKFESIDKSEINHLSSHYISFKNQMKDLEEKETSHKRGKSRERVRVELRSPTTGWDTQPQQLSPPLAQHPAEYDIVSMQRKLVEKNKQRSEVTGLLNFRQFSQIEGPQRMYIQSVSPRTRILSNLKGQPASGMTNDANFKKVQEQTALIMTDQASYPSYK